MAEHLTNPWASTADLPGCCSAVRSQRLQATKANSRTPPPRPKAGSQASGCRQHFSQSGHCLPGAIGSAAKTCRTISGMWDQHTKPKVRQNSAICADLPARPRTTAKVHIGGSARVLLELPDHSV